MVTVQATVDMIAVARIDSLLQRIAKESPKRLNTELRRAALYICQGLKKRTRKAPKKIRGKEYEAKPSDKLPKYIHSHDKARLLRRWALTRLKGTSDEYTRHHYVYTSAKRGKNGRMVDKKRAEEKSELLKFHGGIPRAGLAKKSWGWVAKGIYASRSQGDLSWKRTRGEKRDPRRYVKGLFNAMRLGSEAWLINDLDYILDAMPPGAVSEAITAATNRLEHNINRDIERMIQK